MAACGYATVEPQALLLFRGRALPVGRTVEALMNAGFDERQIIISLRGSDIISIQVDGVLYENFEQILDLADYEAIERLSDRLLDTETPSGAEDLADTDRLFNSEPFSEMAPSLTEQFLAERAPEVWPVDRIIFWIFLPVSLLLFAIAAITSLYTRRLIAREVSAPGQVVELIAQERINSDRRRLTYYFPVVEFYSADGKLHQVQLAEGSSPPNYEVGEQVTVLHDPAKPVRARIQSFSSTLLAWLTPAILALMGTVFLTLALAMRLTFSQPQPIEKAASQSRFQ
ncbi:DUF3592 domain-containing protein [Sphaerothrix gracilis]|uniref:DUF3592 domain-containing protein n=1 Tax=Sphaerothrix gracilis TaxID=3151835 RepID=UPI0031FC04BF